MADAGLVTYRTLSVAGFALGCTSSLPELPSVDRPEPALVRVEPGGDPDRAPAVLRLHVRGASDGTTAEDFLLFEGSLSQYDVSRVVKRDLPQTLLGRSVPVVAYAAEEAGAFTVAPSVVLEADRRYTLAASGIGQVMTLTIGDYAPVLQRVWPPRSASGGSYAVYCGGYVAPAAEVAVLLEPAKVAATLRPGVAAGFRTGPGCVHLRLDAPIADAGLLLPPVEHEGFLLDPAPLLPSSDVPDSAQHSCAEAEHTFGRGCARVDDDRLEVRGPTHEPILWVVEHGEVSVFEAPPAGAPFVLRGFEPETEVTLTLATISLSGVLAESAVVVTTAAPRPHVVINEVLANAIGPEPQQEWVELVNDGRTSVRVGGLRLEDIGGSAELPDYELLPNQIVLVANEPYDPAYGYDVAPVEGTTILRVPRLGKNGLSNSGEPLRLLDHTGRVLSAFPALPKPKPGVSVARRRPWSPDGAADSFSLHGADGASPGAPNTVAD